MSITRETVEQAARLARLTVADADKDRLAGELSAILGFVEQLNAIDTSDVEPLTSVVGATARMRKDAVTAGESPSGSSPTPRTGSTTPYPRPLVRVAQ